MEIYDIIKAINHNQFELLDFNEVVVKDILNLLIEKKWITEKNQKLYKCKKPQLIIGSLIVKNHFGFIESEQDYYVKNCANFFTNDLVLAFIDPNTDKDEAIIIGLVDREDLELVLHVDQDFQLHAINQVYKDYQFALIEKIALPQNSYIKVANPILHNNINYVHFINDVELDKTFDEATNLILVENNIDTKFSQELLEVVKQLDNIDYDNLERKDLTNLDFITIDGTYSKDFDDAVFLEKTNDLYHLYVSIADVSNFVKTGSIIDKEAYKRGNSVYFLDKVIPMLPIRLSNDLCSLNPLVNRYTMTCEMFINDSGNIVDFSIYPSIICSKKRCTYQEVNDFLMRDIINEDLDAFSDMLLLMDELRQILFDLRSKMGSFNFEEQEVHFQMDEEHNIKDIIPYQRENAEKLIEEFMIKANECVATVISQMDLPFIYRVHDQPDAKQLLEIKEQLRKLNIILKENAYLYHSFYQDIKNALNDEASINIIDKLLIRSLPKAKYQMNNVGHYGLAIENYTHFTSPIRRYSDLIVHRLLKKYLIYCDYQMSVDNINQLAEAAKHLTICEIKTQNAERSIIDIKKTVYIKQFVGKKFIGKISNIYENKIIIELPNTIRGTVYLDDYYDFVKVEDFKVYFKDQAYQLLDPVEIEIKVVNEEIGKIIFKLTKYKQKPLFRKGKNKYGNRQQKRFPRKRH